MQKFLQELQELLEKRKEMDFKFIDWDQVKEIQEEIGKISKLDLSQSTRECLENFSTHIMENTIMNDYPDDNGEQISFDICNNLEVETLAQFIADLKKFIAELKE